MRKKAAPRVVVVGSSNTDMIVRVAHVPRPGETLLGGEFLTAAGGKGANQAVAACRSGAKVTFVARVGSDELGRSTRKRLRHEGMDVTHVHLDKTAPSGVALIFVGADGENSIGVAGGANLKLSPADLRRAIPAIRSSKVLLLQLETPLRTVSFAASLGRRSGLQVILNPAPAQALPRSLMRSVDIITPNESEARVLTGIPVASVASATRAARALLACGVRTAAIVTLGARGALVVPRVGSPTLVPAFKVRAVDTTAAGDVFNGALAMSLASGRGLTEAVRYANAAAAISVTRSGAQPSIPSRTEIARLIKR
jgi:ribokinase